MMGWIALVVLAAAAFGAMIALRVPRLLWSMVGAALMLGATGGFGLGLASTRGLVALMGGECGVRRELTHGAAFYVRVPAASEIEEDIRCAA